MTHYTYTTHEELDAYMRSTCLRATRPRAARVARKGETVIVGYDVLARGGFLRKTFSNKMQRLCCNECGKSPTKLYTYSWQLDGRRPSYRDSKIFCNLTCRHIYYS